MWDRDSQSIYWTDINRFLVHRYSLADNAVKTWFFSEPVTCVLLTNRKGTLCLSLGSGLVLWEPAVDTPHVKLFALPGWPFVRCNDAGIDPGGRAWVGSMRNNVKEDGASFEAAGEDGVLYRVDGTGASTECRRELGISNTLLWSPDHTRFYFGDSLKDCIWSYDFDLATGNIRSEKAFLQNFARGVPDGSAIDTDGYVWNCRYGGGCIVRVAPNGTIDRVIEMPVNRPTNCTFGGPDGNVLYVTSASPQSGQYERFGGGLFALETDVAGMPENEFKVT